MSNVGISIDGVDALRRDIGKLAPATKSELKKAIGISLLKIVTGAQQLISSGGRSGLFYTRRSVTHQASAAGEAPKTDRGTLVRNITAEIDNDGLGGDAGSRDAAAHGRWLELGTHNIRARPWLAPTFEKLKEWIFERLQKAVGDAFDGSMGK